MRLQEMALNISAMLVILKERRTEIPTKEMTDMRADTPRS
jgi:hypothetical protein